MKASTIHCGFPREMSWSLKIQAAPSVRTTICTQECTYLKFKQVSLLAVLVRLLCLDLWLWRLQCHMRTQVRRKLTLEKEWRENSERRVRRKQWKYGKGAERKEKREDREKNDWFEEQQGKVPSNGKQWCSHSYSCDLQDKMHMIGGRSLASSPGHSQILSHSRGEKSGEGLGSKLCHGPEVVDSDSTNPVHVTHFSWFFSTAVR